MRKQILILISIITIAGCNEADWNAIIETANAVAQNLEQQNEKIKETTLTQKTQTIEKSHKPSGLDKIAQTVSKAIEPTHPTVRNYAVNLAKKYPGAYTVPQICSIWFDLKENWRYVSDPRGQEYFASANETIKIGLAGDCDDFAILMASLIEAIGGSARIVFTLNAKQGNHAYCEVFSGNNEQETQMIVKSIATFLKRTVLIYTHDSNKSGYWLNLDWSANHPGGPFFEASQLMVIYPNGSWQRVDVQ